MIDRLRGLLDRPLDPRHARAVVVIASCLTAAFAVLVVTGVITGPRPGPAAGPEASRSVPPTAPPPVPLEDSATGSTGTRNSNRKTQDPQDRPDSAAGRRARSELDTHRALQHVPYRRGAVRIDLIGAAGGKAVLRVSARTRSGARAAWRRFLHRFHDDGRSYRVTFDGGRG